MLKILIVAGMVLIGIALFGRGIFPGTTFASAAPPASLKPAGTGMLIGLLLLLVAAGVWAWS